MITYSQLGAYGRLGNQLFQYAMVRAVSLERGYELRIPDPSQIACQNQKCQLDQFNIECQFLTQQDLNKLQYVFMEPDHSKFYREVFETPDNIDFRGYFQSYRYFAKHEATIKEDLRLNDELQEFATDYIENLRTNNEQIISVHFRRGDNVDGTFGRNSGLVDNYFGTDDEFEEDSFFGRYLLKAMKEFPENVKFLVFSGGSWGGMTHNQGDINWCKKNLKDDRFVFCEGNNDMQDFAIMKSCDHNILSHSTSFGYWSALLNSNPNKVVVAPSAYAVPPDGRVNNGFYPPSWKVV